MIVSYPVTLERFPDTCIVRFPDIPEAITEGKTVEDALESAEDCLDVALLWMAEDGRPFPPPSSQGDAWVSATAPIAAKLALMLAWRDSGLSKSAFARRLGKSESEVRTRILNPRHKTALATLDAAARALGRRLVVDLAPAPEATPAEEPPRAARA